MLNSSESISLHGAGEIFAHGSEMGTMRVCLQVPIMLKMPKIHHSLMPQVFEGYLPYIQGYPG